MGRKTKFVFIIGLVLTVIYLFTKPTMLYFLGQSSIGKVINVNVYEQSGRYGSTNYYYQPVVRFKVNNDYFAFDGYISSLEYKTGWDINIIYLPFYVKWATNQPRYDLFNDGISSILVFTIVWVAFFTSFRNLIDNLQIQKLGTFRYKIFYLQKKKK